MKKGDIVHLKIDSAAFQGPGVARAENRVVFVPFTVPGDSIRARVVRKKKKHAEAVLEELLEASPHRVEPRCPYFGTCGGCHWQNLDYPLQLACKRDQVRSLLERIGGFRNVEVAETLPSPEIYYYRNKMEFSFGSNRWVTRQEIESGQPLDRDFALGLHIPRRFDRILDLHNCFLQSETSACLVNFVRRFCRERNWPAYDNRRHTGFLRNLVIREGTLTGQLMVYLVTSEDRPDRMQELAAALVGEFPQLTTFVNGVNGSRSPVARGMEEVSYHGPGFIEDRIAGLVFQISPTSFFQPNTRQAEQLYGVIRQMAQLSGDETVYDLYCGCGSISLFLADQAGRVVGIESHEDSVGLAHENARRNGIENCVFEACDVQQGLTAESVERHSSPDVMVLDPPRSGLHPRVCELILQVRPSRLIYTSCNPSTQARDLQLLSEGFRIRQVQPIDMFPQTYHIENVVLLEPARRE